LGVLAGDHLKSASDLRVPIVGVGLFYQKGYFRQYLNVDGWQQETYPITNFRPSATLRGCE
jgi:starch phosphorylase